MRTLKHNTPIGNKKGTSKGMNTSMEQCSCGASFEQLTPRYGATRKSHMLSATTEHNRVQNRVRSNKNDFYFFTTCFQRYLYPSLLRPTHFKVSKERRYNCFAHQRYNKTDAVECSIKVFLLHSSTWDCVAWIVIAFSVALEFGRYLFRVGGRMVQSDTDLLRHIQLYIYEGIMIAVMKTLLSYQRQFIC